MADIFTTSSIVDRLKDRAPTFRTIGDELTQAEALADGALRPPAAFVITPTERAEDNQAMAPDRHQQLVRSTVSIIIAQVPGRTASDTRSTLDALKQEVLEALTGWTPPAAHTKMQYAAANVLGIGTVGDSGLAYMQVQFRVDWRLRLTL